MNDLVDIIIDNEKYKENLLLTNVKNVKNSEYYKILIQELKERCKERNAEFTYDIKQTRDKFKRCVSACREAALKIKTASGIVRFQDEKDYGSWFNKLFGVVKSMDNCQSEQSIEPDVMMTKSADDTHESIDDADFNTSSSSAATSSGNSECKKRKFVPIHESSRKVAKRLDLQKSLDKINDELANDSTKELISLFKEESNRQQQREDRFMTLMEHMLHVVFFIRTSNFQVRLSVLIFNQVLRLRLFLPCSCVDNYHF